MLLETILALYIEFAPREYPEGVVICQDDVVEGCIPHIKASQQKRYKRVPTGRYGGVNYWVERDRGRWGDTAGFGGD